MSRGFGKQQTAILRKIRTLHEEGHQITAEELRWVLYFEKKEPEQDSENLPKSWCNAFQIALAKLEKGKHIKVHKRVLENFDECVKHYPGKTPDGKMRQLRIRMLPHLNDWLQTDVRRAYPKYGPAQNEVFRFGGMPEAERAAIIRTWQDLGPQLDSIYRTCGQQADDLFLLLCKGREYFLTKDVETHYSLTTLVENTLQSRVLPDPLANAVRIFIEEFMPADQARALSFRSIIHFFSSIPSHGPNCELKEDTLEYLHQKDREFIESMEGTKLSKTPWIMPIIGLRRNFDPTLRKLFDHSVFREFQFLEPV